MRLFTRRSVIQLKCWTLSCPSPSTQKIDPHLRVRRIEGDVIEEAKPMHQPCGAVVPFIRGDAPGVLRGLDLLE